MDASSPADIGDALNRMLAGEEALMGDIGKMRQFAEQNSDSRFAQMLTEKITLPAPG